MDKVRITGSSRISPFRPLYLSWEAGTAKDDIRAVYDGIIEILYLAGVAWEDLLRVIGIWRLEGWMINGRLVPRRSIDWYLKAGKLRLRPGQTAQYDADTILHMIRSDPLPNPRDRHYDVVVTYHDMYSSGTVGNNFVIGSASHGLATVISTHHFHELQKKERYECIKTETMHEVGHVFGLVPLSRTENVEESLGKHCLNICVMRQGLRLPIDWINYSQDRLNNPGRALCTICHRDLRHYFRL